VKSIVCQNEINSLLERKSVVTVKNDTHDFIKESVKNLGMELTSNALTPLDNVSFEKLAMLMLGTAVAEAPPEVFSNQSTIKDVCPYCR